MGYHPNKRRISIAEGETLAESTYIVAIEESMTETVTTRMRARITDGASRERLGEGRVVGER